MSRRVVRSLMARYVVRMFVYLPEALITLFRTRLAFHRLSLSLTLYFHRGLDSSDR